MIARHDDINHRGFDPDEYQVSARMGGRTKNLKEEVVMQWSKTSERKMNWFDAVKYAEELREDGFDDWRLPTIKELFSIVEHGTFSPACSLSECRSYNYWTGSTYANYPDDAWNVNFHNGDVYAYSKHYTLYVRCVRERKGSY